MALKLFASMPSLLQAHRLTSIDVYLDCGIRVHRESISRENPKRDWYVWAGPGPNGSPPNNWLSRFVGGAWEWDAATGQYYYHAFLREQPDLNWRNPQVRAAMADVLRFWLRRGIDGFRIDAAAVLA